jgi:predicted ribosomally synthesized peptide with nif11-like leader
LAVRATPETAGAAAIHFPQEDAMSVSRAQELLKAVGDDIVFRQALENAADKAAKRQILEEHGFGDVTPEDVAAAAQASGTELSDAELEAVAGGQTSQWYGISATFLAAAAAAP